jgi:hypothetical protein
VLLFSAKNEIWSSRVLCLHRVAIVMTFRSLHAVGGILFATLRRRLTILSAIDADNANRNNKTASLCNRNENSLKW